MRKHSRSQSSKRTLNICECQCSCPLIYHISMTRQSSTNILPISLRANVLINCNYRWILGRPGESCWWSCLTECEWPLIVAPWALLTPDSSSMAHTGLGPVQLCSNVNCWPCTHWEQAEVLLQIPHCSNRDRIISNDMCYECLVQEFRRCWSGQARSVTLQWKQNRSCHEDWDVHGSFMPLIHHTQFM